MSSHPPRDHHVHGIEGWRRALLWPLGILVRAWCRTLRIEIDERSRALLSRGEQPLIFTLWHNRLFVAAEVYRRFRGGRPLYALVSASRDGAWLAAFFRSVGMGVVRGSSSKLGREALHQLAERVRQGDDVGITPDGPRGPCYEFKGGGLLLARRTGAPMLLLGIEFRDAWRLRSWDRFYLPRPGSTLVVRCEQHDAAGADKAPHPIAALHARLMALNPDPGWGSSDPARAEAGRIV